MPNIRPLRIDLEKYLNRHQLSKKFAKQQALFQKNSRHPSLHTEILEPKHRDIYSFRLDRTYRVIFIFITSEEVEIIAITRHYED